MNNLWREDDRTQQQDGNAMVYVLIVVALFAALSFTLSRQNDSSETQILSDEKIEIYAGNIQQAAAGVQQNIEQMVWSGSDIDDLSFMLPSDGAFETPPNFNKVYHPAGGALVLPKLRDDMIEAVNNDPAPGWYINRFNNVGWTETAGHDVLMAAHQISRDICARINEKLTGSPTIPQLTVASNRILFASAESSALANIDFTSAECGACYGFPAMCVQDNTLEMFTFYSIAAGQ